MPIRVLRQCLRLALYLQDNTISFLPPKPFCCYQEKDIIPDRVACSKSNPLRDRSILFHGLGQFLLGAEGFMTLYVCVCGEDEVSL